MSDEPPIMRQYKALKRELPTGSILALKLGEFYEMFGDDAIHASSIIGATLTRRCDVAMCGFPQHTPMDCVAKLKAANQTFAIAEEMEGKTQKRGIIRRDVTRIFYPDNNKQKGTETMNTPTQNNTTTETTAPGKVVVVSVDDGDEEQTPASEPQSTIEEQAAPKKAKRTKPLTPAECEKWQQRQRKRIEREQAAVRVIKKLAPQIWHDDWWLKPLDWLEAKATELREAADAAKSAKDKKAA